MKEILNHLFEHKTLTKEQAREVLVNITGGKYNQSQISSFLTVYMMRSITVDELEGFRNALLDQCQRVDLNAYNPIDLCGTGGDGKDTFNISTLSSFVVAANGIPVAKHGNYGVSSSCGSSNVLEALGIKFTTDRDALERSIANYNICFLHAPLFHPAMKSVGSIRKELAVKTFFNMLGPMVNPAFPKLQMVGVYSLELARMYSYLYQQQPEVNYSIIHTLDGYDEISLTSPFKVISDKEEVLLDAQSLGLPRLQQEQIKGGGTIESAAKIFLDVLKGEGTAAQTAVVAANAGMAIQCARPEISVLDAVALAKETLESGKAYSLFTNLINDNKLV
ncbi:anthranilate phosphoribosyltransferase [Pontibacter sp. BT310]|uniref:Anthranilate phosphoribosyltransferase n=1 Tax=Pontibacter populi TaxID=890055 RepID=A0ABS6X9T1_9BACT|nr:MULTISPECIES: anthranilate phosphoribosyltransferase [Pontibacter]MBJ6117901.1 anthranilate phosphoribosyltransferase [Pontibacter sp. BT310]MBR0570328.1 anthranilate phosphoribosyltransferase [Microvirga sp. STS03]MBW3364754.1 anthranilate phosphoribosyltransferase [Pontibacter populi]